MYYVYMLRCQDNSIYTGIAKDLQSRMNDHFTRNKKCAKYTLNHKAKKLECAWKTQDKSMASKLEYYIKKLSKNYKEELIQGRAINEIISDKVDCTKYSKIEISNIII